MWQTGRGHLEFSNKKMGSDSSGIIASGQSHPPSSGSRSGLMASRRLHKALTPLTLRPGFRLLDSCQMKHLLWQ